MLSRTLVLTLIGITLASAACNNSKDHPGIQGDALPELEKPAPFDCSKLIGFWQLEKPTSAFQTLEFINLSNGELAVTYIGQELLPLNGSAQAFSDKPAAEQPVKDLTITGSCVEKSKVVMTITEPGQTPKVEKFASDSLIPETKTTRISQRWTIVKDESDDVATLLIEEVQDITYDDPKSTEDQKTQDVQTVSTIKLKRL